MRTTQLTSLYLDRLGPFFIGRAIWQTPLEDTGEPANQGTGEPGARERSD
jgi:hypothetical protein